MAEFGYRKIYQRDQGASNWDRFQAWQARRRAKIEQFQSGFAMAQSFFSISQSQTTGLSELAAQSAATRVLDKKV